MSQEVLATVCSSLKNFRPDHPGTTFRAWMRGIARNKLHEHRTKQREQAFGGTDAQKRLQEVPAPDADGDLEFDLTDPPTEVTAIYHRALNQVRSQFEDRTWTAFWRVAVENQSPAEVAAVMGITPAAVRQAKSRVLRRLKEELGELIT